MDIELLKNLIEEGLSTYKIAKRVGKSQTTIRYWLKKHKLSTESSANFIDTGTGNGLFCSVCGSELQGRRHKFCSNVCKSNSPSKNNRDYECQQKRSKERKIKLIEMSGGGCEICGYNRNMSALCFHHLDEKNKSFPLEARKLSNTNWESIVNEWEKCQLLCHNCHAEVHYPHNVINP